MCHKYHVKHILKQCNLDRSKSGLKRDTNEIPTCVRSHTFWCVRFVLTLFIFSVRLFVLTLFISTAPNYMLARTLTERVV